MLPGETLAKHTPQAWEETESGEPAFPAVQAEEKPVEEGPVGDLYQETVELEAPAEPLAEAAAEPVAIEAEETIEVEGTIAVEETIAVEAPIEAEAPDDLGPEGEFEESDLAPADEAESVEIVEPRVEEAEPVTACIPAATCALTSQSLGTAGGHHPFAQCTDKRVNE